MHLYRFSREAFANPHVDRPSYSTREQLPLPTQPPFTAHIGNMAFDTTSVDIEELFKDCAVTNVRIVEDKLDRKPKGFGYVEFGTIDGLKKALTYNNTSLGGRQIRVSVAEPRTPIPFYFSTHLLTLIQPKIDRTQAVTLVIGLAKAHFQIYHNNREEYQSVLATETSSIVEHQMLEVIALRADVGLNKVMAKCAISATGRGRDLCPQLPQQLEV